MSITPSQQTRLPMGVWVLGGVSLLMDVSSEMIHSLLPMFMVSTLGMSLLMVGLIEGLAEATALMVKVFSGALSDYWGKRKGLAALGYAMGALTKPLFALANGAGLVLTARVVDRIGKGIRGAPRDAMLTDMVPAAQRGAAFGLRQSLDTVGAFLGPLLAVGLLWGWTSDVRAIFWVAVIPGALAVGLLLIGIREPIAVGRQSNGHPISRANLMLLGRDYWWVVALGGVFTLARFSEAFLVLRAQQSGVALMWVPLVMVAMNLVYALTAYPFGKWSDTRSPAQILLGGMVMLMVADLVLAWGTHWLAVLAGVVLWGVHMGMTQGVLARMVADAAPTTLRGTAFGLFNLSSGVAMLVSSVVAGGLWDAYGPVATFLAGALFCLLTCVLLGVRYSRVG
ncbi:MFS family permease [Chitinivorax tropicus]|uniref:MFS family permease n=1 Tax=Chitinivorax tropicus TaxID=714531 RepID=A0A840MI34_9PROT|nr:MFS transporter [Chitinivorax tropicus]MBB5017185.1 MFS family permease [Chitinivorax tropicus]